MFWFFWSDIELRKILLEKVACRFFFFVRKCFSSSSGVLLEHLKEGWKQDEAWLFLSVPSDRTRGNGHKLKHKCCLNIIYIHIYIITVFMWGWLNTGTHLPQRLWHTHPWRYSKPDCIQSWETHFRRPYLKHRTQTRHSSEVSSNLSISLILYYCWTDTATLNIWPNTNQNSIIPHSWFSRFPESHTFSLLKDCQENDKYHFAALYESPF